MAYCLMWGCTILLLISGVAKAQQAVSPSLLFPTGNQVFTSSDDGISYKVDLTLPFQYNGKYYTELYVNMNGFLAFFLPGTDTYPDATLNKDMIAPLWSDMETYNGGNVTVWQATDGILIKKAQEEISRTFPGLNFNPTWVLVASWENLFFETDSGLVTFQVVLASATYGRSIVLMNYGSVANTSQNWLAGYRMQGAPDFYTILVSSSAELSSTSNVMIPGRWAFQFDLPFSLLFPTGIKVFTSSDDGISYRVQLSHPFLYNGKYYSELNLNMNGFLAFFVPPNDIAQPYDLNQDMIAPLFCDIETYNGGNVTVWQATEGILIDKAYVEISRTFPGLNFYPTWVLVASWENLFFEYESGLANFQVVLASGDDGRSIILMNYAYLANTTLNCMAGYRMEGAPAFYSIPIPDISELASSSNVMIPGRWAFKFDIPFRLFFPTGQQVFLSDGSSVQIKLQHLFPYNRKWNSVLYLSMDGYLAFYSPDIDVDARDNMNKDFIAPLWSDIDTYTRGNITYWQASDGFLLNIAQVEINRTFPELNCNPTWVFIATWQGVFFETDTGDLNFQGVLALCENGSTVVLMNYGDLAVAQQSWRAGYSMENVGDFFDVPRTNISALKFISNVMIPGRWAYTFTIPVRLFFPTGQQVFLSDGTSVQINLQHPFPYNGKWNSVLYLSMDGYLAFYSPDIDVDARDNMNKDFIAPLWSDIDTYTRGNITYWQASDGFLLDIAQVEISRTFPELNCNPTWVFIATWQGVFFETDTGDLNFQGVLALCENGNTVVLMNYGDLAVAQQSWRAGYSMENVGDFFDVPRTNISALKFISNVNIPGRWAYTFATPVLTTTPASPPPTPTPNNHQGVLGVRLTAVSSKDLNALINSGTFDAQILAALQSRGVKNISGLRVRYYQKKNP